MITILHGDNQVSSRQALVEYITAVKSSSELVRLEGKTIQFATLESALRANSLFGNNRTVVIEGLHVLPKSKKLTELINLIITHSPDTEILLWEGKSLTKTMLKPFQQAQAKISEFKVGKLLFNWLDTLDGTQNETLKYKQLERFHRVLEQEDVWLCLAMITYRVRQLLTLKTGGTVAGAPFMVSKLEQQARRFSEKQLFKLHEQLYTIDKDFKSSSTLLDLSSTLDLLLLTL